MTAVLSRKPIYKEIALDDLFIDPTYQRDPREPSFKRMKTIIVNEFDPPLLHALDVSYWDNCGDGAKFWVYDGYCRLDSVRELRAKGEYPDDTITCAVIEVDQDEQARLFLKQTARRGVLWKDKHHAALAFKDPSAVAIQKVFDDLGITIGKSGDVRAVQACYSTVEIDCTKAHPDAALRPDLLREVLIAAGTAWSDDGTLSSGLRVQYASSDRMIDALALLHNKYDANEMPRDGLVRALKQHYPPYLVEKAAKKTSAHGSNNKGALAAEILTLYNKVNGKKLHKSRIISQSRQRRRGRGRGR